MDNLGYGRQQRRRQAEDWTGGRDVECWIGSASGRNSDVKGIRAEVDKRARTSQLCNCTDERMRDDAQRPAMDLEFHAWTGPARPK